MAVPDTVLGGLSHTVVPKMKSNATFILLDPAAAYAKEIALRDDITFVVVHPCHPAVFFDPETAGDLTGVLGTAFEKQDIVVALLQGEEERFQQAMEICKQMFSPLNQAYRVTVAQMAMLEPAVAEVVAATIIVLMKDAMDEAVKRGVPEKAARSFMLGHISDELLSVFVGPNTFSAACYKAMDYGMEKVVRPGWREVFEEKSIQTVLQRMLHPDGDTQHAG